MADSWQEVVARVEEASGFSLETGERRPRGGGCINDAWSVPGVNGEAGQPVAVFVKVNRPEMASMFEAEKEALGLIGSTNTIRVPRPIACGIAGEEMAFLALEFLDIRPISRGNEQREMGIQLAKLHQVINSNRVFGWDRDNTIGATPQRNAWTSSWVEFFRVHRLGYQLELAADRGREFRGAARLLERLPEFFAGDAYDPVPSLLHGDLWGGNAGYLPGGEPVVFDPATYYGDRETDLAFTSLFGGFGADFYEGYEATWPLHPGFSRRKPLYNLYHVLNHDHLFGGGYAQQAQVMIDRLLGGLSNRH